MGMKRPLICVVMIIVTMSGCFDLDSSLFNQKKLSSYSLSTDIIPESQRSQVVLTVQEKKVYGYFIASSVAGEKNVVLYNHGNRDHLQFYWDRAEHFYAMGFNVFIYDYEGYGMSEGEPTEAAIYADATAAYEYLRTVRGFSDGQITVYGFSLGGAPSTYLAANVFTPHRLILEAPFASATALTQSGTLLDLPGAFVMEGTYDNAERIRVNTAPLLILHGTDDTFIDLEKNGKVIYNNANDPKSFIAVKGAGHSTIPATMGVDLYRQTVKDFILLPQ